MKTFHPHHRQRGLSLIELMIAMVAGLIFLSGTIALFIGVKRSFNEDEQTARMLDSGRFALAQIANDVMLAGFWGASDAADDDITMSAAIRSGSNIGNDCGSALAVNGSSAPWAYNVQLSLEGSNNATGAINSTWTCFSSDEVYDGHGAKNPGGTDILAIRRVNTAPTPTDLSGAEQTALTNDPFLDDGVGDPGEIIQFNSTRYGQFVSAATDADTTNDFDLWRYMPKVYFIRSYSVADGDGIPTLCQKTLTGNPPTFTTECLAEGIEDLQIEYGIDSSGDGATNYYTDAPTLVDINGDGIIDYDEQQRAVGLRVTIVARSVREITGFTDEATYNYADQSLTPDDGFLRRTYSMIIPVRNPARLRQLYGS